jgi:hypothetical protein
LNQPVVRIALSGHRQLDDLSGIELGVKIAEERILERFPDRRFLVYSCLAEGSDQLLAGRLIEALSAELIAVLPLPEGEYAQDFERAGSLEGFNRLKHLAVEVVSLDGELVRPAAYEAANEYLIRHCDVLVVIWDGLPARGEGGTGDMVAMARQAGRALLWIHSNPQPDAGPVTEERLPGKNGR